jgi:hypothetical protein
MDGLGGFRNLHPKESSPAKIKAAPRIRLMEQTSLRVRTFQIPARGLKPFCSGLGRKPQEYQYIARFLDAALGKMGQILWTS